MNILPKKSWHVFKPENVERVLKDEAAARERSEAQLHAQLGAEKDLRVARLRSNGAVASNAQQSQHISSGEEAHANVDGIVKRDQDPANRHINLFEGNDFDFRAKARKFASRIIFLTSPHTNCTTYYSGK